MNSSRRVAVVLAMVMLLSRTATASPTEFTAQDLVGQSQTILVLAFQKVAGDGDKVSAKVTRVIKGEFAQKEIIIHLDASVLSERDGKKLKRLIGLGQKQGLLFVGSLPEHEEGMDPEEPEGHPGILHLAGEFTGSDDSECFWLESVDAGLAKWDLGESSILLGYSTDMLLKCIDYVLTDKNADVPAYSDAAWAPEVTVAKVSGKVYGAKAIDLTGSSADGQADLFIAADSGDRLFRYAEGKMADITGTCKLTSRSKTFAWGDFDGNGTLDLASYDGKRLTLYSQQADGRFVGKPCDTGDALAGVIALSTVDVGNKGIPALVVTGKGYPALLTFGADGKGTVKTLGKGEFPEKDAGTVGHSLVADFDGDGVVDIVQLGSKAGLFYKGKYPGTFAAPVATRTSCGEGRSAVCLGDFDADGLPDILTVAEDRNHLWQNTGQGKFVNMMVVSGAISHSPKTGGVAVDAGDFNNDGRVDALIAYGTEQKPRLFFNRGFRSFGHAYVGPFEKLKQAGMGQQAGCLGDFTGDGTLDILLVLKTDGQVRLYPRKVYDGMEPLAVVVALPLGGATAGPVNVCAWTGNRPMGAQVVRAGEPGAFYGTRHPGPVVLKWKTPDGKEHEKTVVVGKGPVRVTLDEGR